MVTAWPAAEGGPAITITTEGSEPASRQPNGLAASVCHPTARSGARRGHISGQQPRPSHFGLVFVAALLASIGGIARAEVASVYGEHDGLCSHRTANGVRLNCSAMTAAHRTLPFGARVRVCHNGCVIVRIYDRGPWVRGRHIDLSPAAARSIGLYKAGCVTLTFGL
jgi:peptidoglycan lytic transglycosylase